MDVARGMVALGPALALAAALAPGAALAEVPTARLGGANRYETMARIVGAGFQSSEWAVVATGDSFPDALSASGLAGSHACPVVLTGGRSLSSEARSELKRLGVRSVVIAGGSSSVSDSVASSIRSMGISVTRAAGADRVATSLEAMRAARAAGSTSDTIVLCSGDSFADALSAGPWAWATASPVVLCRGGRLSSAAVSAIRADALVRRVVLVGGTGSVSDDVLAQLGPSYEYVRLAGSDRYDTSAQVADWCCSQGLSWVSPAVATGETFPDALAGSALCGSRRSPLILCSPSSSGAVASLVSSHASEVSSVSVLGGEGSVSEATVRAVAGAPAETFSNPKVVDAQAGPVTLVGTLKRVVAEDDYWVVVAYVLELGETVQLNNLVGMAGMYSASSHSVWVHYLITYPVNGKRANVDVDEIRDDYMDSLLGHRLKCTGELRGAGSHTASGMRDPTIVVLD